MEELSDRLLLADDLGIFPRRDYSGVVIVDEPEVVYSELEDKLLSFENSVFHPKAVTVETEVPLVVTETVDNGNAELVQGEEETTIITEVMLDDESNYFWLYILLLLLSFFVSCLLMLSRPFIHFLGNRRNGPGGSACYKVACWLWAVRMWVLRKATLRFGNLGVVRKTHTRGAMRKYLRDYNFQLEDWEAALNCAPTEALIVADQHSLVDNVRKLLDRQGSLACVNRIKQIYADYSVKHLKVDKWLDRQSVRYALVTLNDSLKDDPIDLAEGMLSLHLATFEDVLRCDVETQRGSMYFTDLIAMQFAFRLVGTAEFSDFVMAYKGPQYPCYVEAIKKHGEKLVQLNADDDLRRKNEKAMEWLTLACQGAFVVTTALTAGAFVFTIHKWLKKKLLLRALAALPSVGGGPEGGGGNFSLDALELYGQAHTFEERLAALQTGLDCSAVNMVNLSTMDMRSEIEQVIQTHVEGNYHEDDEPFADGMGVNFCDLTIDTSGSEPASTMPSTSSAETSISLGRSSKARRRAVGKSSRVFPGGTSAYNAVKQARVSGSSGVSGIKMKIASRPLAS